MAIDIKKPEIDLVLRHLTDKLKTQFLELFGYNDGKEFIDAYEEIQFLFDQIETALRLAMTSVYDQVVFPYQTLTTSASNLGSGTLHGSTKTQSVLTTSSESTAQFDWKDSKRARSSLVVVGPGDGVEPHVFLVNHHYNGPAFRVDSTGTLVQRNGVVIPYADGTSQQLMFIEFDEADSYLPKPADLGLGTKIYLEQRMSGE